MATEIDSTKMSQVKGAPFSDSKSEMVQTPTAGPNDVKTADFLDNITAADPDSFNVCISCD